MPAGSLSALAMISAQIEYILRSAKSGNVLFHRESDLTLDLSAGAQCAGGLFGLLTGMAAGVINTITTDKIEAARLCNRHTFNDLPKAHTLRCMARMPANLPDPGSSRER